MKVFVHVDADPDYDKTVLSESLRQRSPRYFRWDGLISAVSAFETYREKMGSLGFDFKAVFFLRADEQIRTLYGTFSNIFAKFHDRVHKSFGIGWHPHLFRWSEGLKCWCQEFQDNEWIQKTLADCYDDLRSQGFHVEHTKMGWCFHNNRSMKTLSDLGIEADFSALHGARSPGRLVGHISFQDRYDWSRTSSQPYHPNEHDYQRIGVLRILEIPLTTYKISGSKEFLYTLKLASSSYRRLDFSYGPSFSRMVPLLLPDLTKLPNLKGFCESLMSGNRDYIALYLHPNELLDTTARTVFENFLLQIVHIADERRLELSFVDAMDLFSLYT